MHTQTMFRAKIRKIWPTKKESQQQDFPVKFSFKCQNANCHKILSFKQISTKLELGLDEYLCFPCV